MLGRLTGATVNGGPMLIIANPTSGRGRGGRTADAVAGILRAHGVDVTLHCTTASGDAERLTHAAVADGAQRPNCMVACGGDGTIQEVANALAEAQSALGDACPALGLAPAGRCNDFARAFGIPTDPRIIADVLLHGRAVPTDLGRVNGRYFCTVATAGVDADVSSFVDTMRMPLRGTPAYLYGAIRVLIRNRPYEMKITGDFGVIERALLLASSANTSSYGGAIRIAPDADPADGRLDLCIVDRVGRLRAIALIPSLLAGRHSRCSAVHFLRTRRLTIESPRPLELWADGERIARTPATIDVAPAAIRVLRPL
ncbi:MAG: diacylglycerol kinase family protein [Planctomycetota bacterium]